MRISLKEFQIDYVADLAEQLKIVQGLAPRTAAALLNAPTGAGKTLMVTALIESMLAGSENSPGDPNLTFLWLTDQPELNKQTYDKMVVTSSLLTPAEMVIIDASLDDERLRPGRVYFLNTQKLGAATSFVKTGDGRTFTLWQTITNTIAADPRRFVLIVDEAHRGTKGREAVEAETIMQKFLLGSRQEMVPVPIVLGISATPDRFVTLCNESNRPVFTVDVDVERVRDSGLLKEYVDLFHPDEAHPADVTMLVSAVKDWQQFRNDWYAYGEKENEVTPRPVLLIQVEDARSSSNELSRTDLPSVVGTAAREMGSEALDGWIAHAFQDQTDVVIAGQTVRYLAPSAIDADAEVKVVLFKSSLNTGWDCPRAEVMVSFRTARDETNIAQLVGRMVRAPLARRIVSNEHLNTVALYLPQFDPRAVEKIVIRLTGDPDSVPPTKVREGKDAVSLTRATSKSECFDLLARLPSYTVPRSRPMKAVPRLGKLAGLLAETELERDPVKDYRKQLTQVLLTEHDRLKGNAAFKALVDEAGEVEIRRRRVAYAVASGEEPDQPEASPAVLIAIKTAIADENVDDLFAETGRQLGEGLHKEYLRSRVASGLPARDAKLELYSLVSSPGVLDRVNQNAETIRIGWTSTHRAALAKLEEKFRTAFREIEAAGANPELTAIDAPQTIEWTNADRKWPEHLYIASDGHFPEDFSKSSWETLAVEHELASKDLAGWLRNPDRKSWSLCIARREGMRWVPFYPDFVLFRKSPSGVVAEIVDPHLMSADDMPQRAVRLAQYAQDHSDMFGRIEMLIFESPTADSGKRLDLMNESIRQKVAIMTSREQLKQLFHEAK